MFPAASAGPIFQIGHHQRVVPGRDLPDDADRLAADHRRVAAHVLAGRPCPRASRAAPAKKRRLSTITGSSARATSIGLPTFSDSSCASSSAFASMRSASPSSASAARRGVVLQPLRKCLRRRLDGAVDVRRGSARHLGDRLAGRRVQDLHRAALDGVDPLAPDEVPGLRDRDAHDDLRFAAVWRSHARFEGHHLSRRVRRGPIFDTTVCPRADPIGFRCCMPTSRGSAAAGACQERALPPVLLGLLAGEDRRADDRRRRSALIGSGGSGGTRRVTSGSARPFVLARAVTSEARIWPPSQARAHAAARVADPVVDAGARNRAEERQVVGRHVDRPAPRALDPASASPGSSLRSPAPPAPPWPIHREARRRRGPPRPIGPEPLPMSTRPSAVVRK